MYPDAAAIAEAESLYGSPTEYRFTYAMGENEYAFLRYSMRRGRAHDLTAGFSVDGGIVVIRKQTYPPGVFRPPSGGARPGEGVREGLVREAHEETGLWVEPERYVLRAYVKFTWGAEVSDWTTHVLTARPTGGTLAPIDTEEIAEVAVVTPAELYGPLHDGMLTMDSSGMAYRAELTRVILRDLDLAPAAEGWPDA